MAAARFRNMNGGEKKLQCLGGGGSPFHGEKTGRKGERGRGSSVLGSCKKNTPPRPLTGESRITEYGKFVCFFQTAELKF